MILGYKFFKKILDEFIMQEIPEYRFHIVFLFPWGHNTVLGLVERVSDEFYIASKANFGKYLRK